MVHQRPSPQGAAAIRRRATTLGYSLAERAGADEAADYLTSKEPYLTTPPFWIKVGRSPRASLGAMPYGVRPNQTWTRDTMGDVEIRELRAFVVVVEEGGLSPAARRLHLSQPALSQTVQSLERQLGVQLLVRNHAGSRTTDAGELLLREARELIEHHDRVKAAMAAAAGTAGSGATAGLIRIGVPLESPPGHLPAALGRLAVGYPDTRVKVVHSSSATQLAALRSGDLDVGLVRDRPSDPRLDALLAVQEEMGVILATARAEEIGEPAGVHLHKLAGLRWMGFARSDSPAWHDQVSAILRGHGIAVDDQPTDDRPVTAEVKLAGIGTGKAFGFASPGWAQALPEGMVWYPLVGNPIVRRTWVVWQAATRHRDIAALIDALEITAR